MRPEDKGWFCDMVSESCVGPRCKVSQMLYLPVGWVAISKPLNGQGCGGFRLLDVPTTSTPPLEAFSKDLLPSGANIAPNYPRNFFLQSAEDLGWLQSSSKCCGQKRSCSGRCCSQEANKLTDDAEGLHLIGVAVDMCLGGEYKK